MSTHQINRCYTYHQYYVDLVTKYFMSVFKYDTVLAMHFVLRHVQRLYTSNEAEHIVYNVGQEYPALRSLLIVVEGNLQSL